MSNIDISITTSSGESYKLTLNPATGNGVLHPVEDFCDKVRIKDFELDNEDGIFYIDYYLEKEWEELLEAALSERADAWLKTESVLERVKALEQLEEEIEKDEELYLEARREKIKKHTQILESLHKEASAMGGFDRLKDTVYTGCGGDYEEIKIIEKGLFEIRELL